MYIRSIMTDFVRVTQIRGKSARDAALLEFGTRKWL